MHVYIDVSLVEFHAQTRCGPYIQPHSFEMASSASYGAASFGRQPRRSAFENNLTVTALMEVAETFTQSRHSRDLTGILKQLRDNVTHKTAPQACSDVVCMDMFMHMNIYIYIYTYLATA